MRKQDKTKVETLQKLQRLQQRVIELEKTEDALHESEQRFRIFAEQLSKGSFFRKMVYSSI